MAQLFTSSVGQSAHSSSGQPETVSVWSVLSKRLGTAVVGPPFAAKTALTRKGMDSTTRLNVCCGVSLHDISSRSFKSCRVQGGASMDWTCLSSTSHRCSIGLRSEEFGGQVNTVNWSLCSSNHSWTSFAVWLGVLSHWKKPLPSGKTVCIKGWTWSARMFR